MMTKIENEESASGRSAVGNFLKQLVKFFLILLVFSLVVYGVIYGGVLLYNQVIVPIRQNSANIQELHTRQGLIQQGFDERQRNLTQRMNTLETDKDLEAEKLAELSIDISRLENELGRYSSMLDRLEKLELELKDLEERLEKEAAANAKLEETLLGPDSPIEILRQEFVLFKAIELLNRSRIFLLQNNFGLAIRDIEKASQVLEKFVEELPEEKATRAENWIERLEIVLELLPEQPVSAANELEIAWQSLINGFSDEAEQVPSQLFEEAFTPVESPMGSPTPDANQSATATPVATATPTPAP
jgi:hypothetical protein